MTGYQSKKAAAQAIDEVNWADHEPNGRRAAALDDDDAQVYIAEYEAALQKEYQRGYYDGKKAAQPEQGPQFTTGHCESHKQPGGCTLNNIWCEFPNCDRKRKSVATGLGIREQQT